MCYCAKTSSENLAGTKKALSPNSECLTKACDLQYMPSRDFMLTIIINTHVCSRIKNYIYLAPKQIWMCVIVAETFLDLFLVFLDKIWIDFQTLKNKKPSRALQLGRL